MDTQTQIERLIDLAIIQRSELKKLVSELPQLREHLNAEIERVFEDAEPQLRTELEDWTTKQAKDQTAKLGGELEAKIAALSKSLEATTQTRYNAIMAERAQNIDLAKKAEDKLAEVAQAIPVQVKQIVTDELARFPRAGEIDQLRKEFAEPRGLNPRGRWQVGETYNKLDLVSYNGDSYVSNTNGNREKPSRSSEAWTLSAARGNGGAGGGVTSLTDLVAVPANGELLIGNGSAFVNNTITGGTGVTVTNGPGTITIDASGAQELLTATVTNAESVAITRGQVVYIFGATGNRASVKLANNTTDAASSKTFGVVSEASIAAGANGLVTCVGTVDKLTLGSYTEGDVLYLGATPGALTNVKPYAPNHLVYVGIVERANNGNGELYVRIQNGFELDELHDVQITSAPLAGSLLMRDATNSLWKANRLTGTANQVTVTNADTAVTLSLPTTVANVNSITAATTQNLTLAGGSTGASLVLGQGASAANATLSATGTGRVVTTPVMQIGSAYNVAGTLNTLATVGTLTLSDNVGFNLSNADGTRNLRASLFLDATNYRYGLQSVYSSASDFRFVIRQSGVDQLQVTQPGNLLIGTTTDISGSGNLAVAGGTVTAGAAATNLTLSGGSTGASLVLGQGANANATITPTGTGGVTLQSSANNGDVLLRLRGTNASPNGTIRWTTSTDTYTVGIGSRFNVADSGLEFLIGSSTTGMNLRSTGNLLIGTTTDSGNGKLQLATHTTSAGGIGFGTDVSLFRSATGVLRLAGTSNYLHEIVNTAGTSAATTVYSNTGGNLFVGIDSSSGGAIGAGAYSGVISRDGAYPLILRTNGTTALTLASNQAATFAGAVAINNTVATGVAVASTHKVTMVIGGVTYYLLASNV